jgi:magnesium-transporting ATPase (P-type)
MNTEYVYGMVLYTGHTCKIVLNTRSLKAKLPRLHQETNRYILLLFIGQTVVCFMFTGFYFAWTKAKWNDLGYLLWSYNDALSVVAFWIEFGRYILLVSQIPLSILVQLEIVRIVQAK